MNKNELIEKAVIELNGVLPQKILTPCHAAGVGAIINYFGKIRRCGDDLDICTEHEFNAAADRMRGKPDWSLAPEWAISLAQDENGSWWFYDSMVQSGNAAFVNPMGGRSQKAGIGKTLGDWRNTLEKRPEQKVDPLNGYKWGVEYPCGGKRPELDDDIQVDWLGDGEWNSTRLGYLDWSTTNPDLTIVEMIKITDQRYKPAEPEQPEPTSAKPWFEAGKFPPVGECCEFLYLEQWHPALILAIDGDAVWVKLFGSKYKTSIVPKHFRPIKTDKEKAIEAAIEAMQPNALTGTMAIWFGKLYDAGLLRLPDQK